MWKPVVGYEKLYKISTMGEILSCEKYAGRSFRKEKIIATFEDKTGYVKVNLYKDNKHKQLYVHRIVAEAFIPNPLNLQQVNHKDGNKSNNNLSNLEWCSPSENIKHAYSTGLKQGKKGKNHPMFGKKHSIETIIKCTKASRSYWKGRCDNKDVVL